MKPHRRSLLAGLAATPLAGMARPRARIDDLARREAALDLAFADHAPVGLAGAVVTGEGLAWSGSRGRRRLGDDEQVTTADRWHLGSNTKAMTAAVFARLVEQGRARWGMPLAEAFPGLAMDPGWADTALDDVMHHRAGLRDEPAMGRTWLLGARADPRALPEQRAAIAARALGAPPGGTRGEFAYGNANYVVVGAAIEAITGGSWEDALRAELFGPLGMGSAGFGAPADPPDNAWGHRGAGDGRTPLSPGHPGADNPLALGPAGTAHMTLEDYGRFLAAMMGARPDWLGRDSLDRLTTPPPGSPPAYACGWGVGRQSWAGAAGPGPVLSHDGSNTLWYCSAAVAPERGVALVAVSNEGAAGEPACRALIRGLAAASSAG